VLHIRTSIRPKALVEPVRRALHAIDSRLPFYDVRTLDEEVSASIWPERALAWLSTLFRLSAVCLAVLAVYGTLAYAISQGKREIGIRKALGASAADVLRANFIRPTTVIGIGIAIGLAVFYSTIPRFRNVLYDVSPAEPVNVAVAAAAVMLVGAGATFSASRKALRVDPADVLRAE
jgi:ABC-type antimicrobial peptide transport system permease subunit